MNNSIKIILLILLFSSCTSNRNKQLLHEVSSKRTTINFVNKLKETRNLNALSYMYFYDGAGVAVGDINNDGLPDIYFVANMGKNKLYLNEGNFKFKDITEKAGVAGKSDWNTGVSMVDINNDGLLDIYVCAVTGINGFKGHNELFINNGDNTFTEQAHKYGLDFKTYSCNAAFFDYDGDGDLDMYLLNEGKHSAASFGPASNRNIRNDKIGDKLLRNDNGKFVDVSKQAGIYGGPNGYGLGVGIADFNNDGWPDIYVSNDFHENDYYYINNGDGTFKEELKDHFGKVSRYSMGNDIADINHDGYPDIFTLDMMPENEKALQETLGDNTPEYHKIRKKLGYFPQFSRNMLQINNQGTSFSETALISGIAATDWSWSPLFADLNQDGYLDLFITNGIYKRLNDLDYLKAFTKIAQNKQVNTKKLFDENLMKLMPSGKVHNYLYEGTNSLKFIDKSSDWIKNKPTLSSGLAYGDFDNDGDLDLVINNYNSKPIIYENKVNDKTHRYLKIKFNYTKKNHFGIGTKVVVYTKSEKQYQQLYTTRGFQSSVEPIIHFGFGNTKLIDSLLVIWPDNTYQKLRNIKTNQTITIKPTQTRNKINYKVLFPKAKKWFKKASDSILTFRDIQNRYSDFIRQKLIPYKISNEGPAVAVGDVNGDGKQDVFFGGAKHKKARLYIQVNNKFKPVSIPIIENDSLSEDVDALFFDADNDGDLDLFVVSAGGEFYGDSKPLLDRIYFNDGHGNFTKRESALPKYYTNGSVVRAADIDHDGDLDLFIAGGAVADKFGKLPKSYLLINDGKGNFTIKKGVLSSKIGMIKDAVFTDFDNYGDKDLIVVGEWMSPKFYQNNNGVFTDVTSSKLVDKNLKGLWQSIIPFDIDHDGDLDYLVGNWGLNSKFVASKKYPLKMFVNDFNGDGKTETIIAIQKNSNYYPINSMDLLNSQMGNLMDKKFKKYSDFAGKTIDEVFDKNKLKNAKQLTINQLNSGYLENIRGKFKFKKFSDKLQLAPITSFLKYDFDGDGKEEVLIGGNKFGLAPYNGKLDANLGFILKNKDSIFLGIKLGINLSNKEIKAFNILKVNKTSYVMVTVKNDNVMLFKVLK